MNKRPAAIFFDSNDYQLLDIVREVLEKGSRSKELRSLLVEHMHPHGIKEMAAPRGLRIAYAIASLLGSFEQGRARDRIKALRVVRDEVSLSSTSFYQKNTARVQLQIMKDLLRVKDNELRQLKLAHDFRMVSTGNPRLVRAELAKYHLLEMPEEWNQYTFDDRVHDANTKGRKSPTHLVMDAWIKGIRYLTVVYYNYVRPDVIEELIEASAILDIHVQVGIEMSCRFRDKYVRFTWEPHGFNDNRAFLKFLKEEAVIQLMEEGRLVSEYQQKYVFDMFDVFNARHRETLNRDLHLSLEPLPADAFLRFIGTGQPSVLHLARFIHNALADHIQAEIHELQQGPPQPSTDSTKLVQRRLAQLQEMDVETIIDQFLLPSRNPEVHDPSHPQDSPDVPPLLLLDLNTLLARLLSLHSSSKFTLNLSNLSIQDTLELLYLCEGMISHIEAYNLKNAAHGITSGSSAQRGIYDGEVVDLTSPEQHYALISELQQALNEDNVISLKRVIRAIIWEHEEQRLRHKNRLEQLPEDQRTQEDILQNEKMQERKLQLMDILYHLENLHNFYKKRTLGSRIGSGSTGQAEHQHGMGLVILDTLPARAKKVVREGVSQKNRSLIPVTGLLTRNAHYRCRDGSAAAGKKSFWSRLPFLNKTACRRWNDWDLDGFLVHPPAAGNIATLGGLGKHGDNGKLLVDRRAKERLSHPWKYLNTNLKNSLKVVLGFIPAFLTFSLTKDWWLLAYLGAFIWFGITGTRNIIQSVLGGGGLRRSPLLPWNSLVSWSRIADSLLYTGFSVPLLDYLVKTLLLDRAFGITTATNPVLLYSVMGLANGIYISTHNTFRGLPRSAAVGNFFRSILAIPLAILLNSAIGVVLQLSGVPDISGVLQKWAAIISKFASDCVAAVIEGLADRQTNIRLRLAAYRTKITQLFAVFSRLDLQFPEEDVLEMLQSPKMMMQTLNYEAREQERLIIVNALDLMYFWMYQPRAGKALEIMVQKMTREEWLIFYRSQLVLNRHREVSQFFVDGLVGKDFSKPLSFYLDRSTQYLIDMEKLGSKIKWRE
ncbi:hypothetical protein FCL47_22940 [Desulfopila sp. IMCC35006]|uniref:hypothetical protein n=1 Tax=Desulfopila sp. IMCC35006 TaxID=2569542 RepID=UPI0010AB83A5|nr:hypothetical protein [Desulfopila sp. IMCC35006]TKB23320.1 hypothetical protein FCL47_22940 [Desulfopila sp. IMCC35006]